MGYHLLLFWQGTVTVGTTVNAGPLSLRRGFQANISRPDP